MKRIALVLAFFLPVVLSADDGIFYSSGGTIIPVKEEKISIRKEILTLTFINPKTVKLPTTEEISSLWKVDVYFEFFNPGKTRTLSVGFVGMDSERNSEEANSISDAGFYNFSIVVNGKRIPVDDIVPKNFEAETGNDMLRHLMFPFQMTLKPGINIVKHSYLHRGFLQLEGYYARNGMTYIITTGKGWAGGVIHDFELRMKAQEDTFYYLDNPLGTDIPWSPVQSSLDRCHFLRAGESYILREKNYAPSTEITVSALSTREIALATIRRVPFEWDQFFSPLADEKAILHDMNGAPVLFLSYAFGCDEATLRSFHPATLALFRNTLYAYYGYPFVDKKYKEFFSSFFFYRENRSFRESALPKKIKEQIKLISKIEADLKTTGKK